MPGSHYTLRRSTKGRIDACYPVCYNAPTALKRTVARIACNREKPSAIGSGFGVRSSEHHLRARRHKSLESMPMRLAPVSGLYE